MSTKPHYLWTPDGPKPKRRADPAFFLQATLRLKQQLETTQDKEAAAALGLSAVTPSPNEIKHRLRQQGKTLKDFARENNFRYRTVSDVGRGLRQGNYGEGREVRLKLGLPVND